MNRRDVFTLGGNVQAGSGFYISRNADKKLYDCCRRGQMSYVLSARHTGKSSLMFNVSRILNSKGITTVIVDLEQVRYHDPEQWYLAFFTRIAHRLNLRNNISLWWKSKRDMDDFQKVILFFREILLTQFTKPIVIFIDQIHHTLNLPFSTDDFYAAIRHLNDLRSDDQKLRQLTFVLLGSASPQELMGNEHKSPFANSQPVLLDDFTPKEMEPFVQALDMPTSQLRLVLPDIFKWTHGHPYFTQLLCHYLAQRRIEVYSKEIVTSAVHFIFLGKNRFEDEHVRWVQNRLLGRLSITKENKKGCGKNASPCVGSRRKKNAVLRLYGKVRSRQGKIKENEKNPIIHYLKLSGIVVTKNEHLYIRNRIYEHLFSAKWASENRVKSWQCFSQKKMLGVFVLMLAILAGIWIAMPQMSKMSVTEGSVSTETQSNSNDTWQAFKTKIASAVAEMARRLRGEGAEDEETNNPLAEFESTRKQSDLKKVLENALEALNDNADTGEDAKALLGTLFNRDVVQRTKFCKQVTPHFANQLSAFTIDKQHDRLIVAEGKQIHSLDLNTGMIVKTAPVNNSPVQSMTVSPDAKTIASASGNAIDLYDALTLENQQVLGFDQPVKSIAYSPDAQTLAAGVGQTIQLIDTKIGAPVQQLDAGAQVRSLDFSSDGQYLAAALSDNRVSLWPTENQKETASLTDHKAPVNHVRFTPDSRELISSDDDGDIQIHETDTWEVGTLSADDPIKDLAVSSDGNQIAATTDKGDVMLWSLKSKELMLNFDGERDFSGVATFDANNDLIYSCPDGRALEKLNTNDLQVPSSFTIPQEAPVEAMLVDDNYIFLADSTLFKMPMDNIDEIHQINSDRPVTKAKFYPNLNAILLTTPEGIEILDLDKYAIQSRILTNLPNIADVALNWDGENLLVATPNDIRLYRPGTKDMVFSRQIPNTISATTFGPTGDSFLAGNVDGIIDVRNLKGFDRQTILSEHHDKVNRILVNDVSNPIFSASDDSTIVMWDSQTYEKLHIFKGHMGAVNDLVYLPDSRVLVSCSSDHNIIVWDVDSRSQLAILKGHQNPVTSLSYDPDRHIVTSVSSDNHVRLWDMTLVDGLKPGKVRGTVERLIGEMR